MRTRGLSRGQLLAGAAAVFYALQNLSMRVAAPAVDPLVVTLFAGFPTLITALAVTLASPSRRARLARLGGEARGRWLMAGLAAAGVVMYLVGNPLFVRALALGGAVVATPTGSTVVIWSALLAAVLLRERMNRLATAGIAVFVAGVLLLSLGQASEVPAGPGWYWAIPLGTAAGLCWSTGGLGTRLAHSRGVDTFAILALYGVAGLGAVGLVSSVTGGLGGFFAWLGGRPDAGGTLAALVLAGLFNLGAEGTLTVALRLETVARTAVISSSSVTIVALLAWAFLGDALNLTMLAGVLAVFAGAALVQSQTVRAGAPGALPGPTVASGGPAASAGPSSGA